MSTNINEFLKKFKANQQIALDASAKVVNATALQMYKRIVDRTPVGDPSLWNPPHFPKDYTPGTLKASWQISFDGKQRATTGRFADAGQMLGSGGLTFKINANNNGQSITISNPQPYAQRVETGWSSQAPQGMMRVTIAEYTSIINSNAKRYRIK